MKFCQCGCGEAVNEERSFVNKEHQLRWMTAGGAKELGRVNATKRFDD